MQEGLKTKRVTLAIPEEVAVEYAEAIGLTNPVFLNRDEARKKGYQDLILPATIPVLFWKKLTIPWLQSFPSVIHGEQSFVYDRPLYAGYAYDCEITLKKVETKKKWHFLVHELAIYEQEELIATSTSTLIVPV